MKIRLLLIILLLPLAIQAQEAKFGKVGTDDFINSENQKDSTAAAEVLYRKVTLRYFYKTGAGFFLFKDVYERIHIHNKDGYNYATVSESLYRSGNGREGVSGLRGVTYNMVDGKLTEDKLKRSDSFSEEVNDYYNREKFTMPNVREGSIIEYEYTVESPFVYSIDELPLQYDIPIQEQDITVEIPEFFVFKPIMKGYLPLNPQFELKQARVNFTSSNSPRTDKFSNEVTYSNSSVDYRINVLRYKMKDVPALKAEPYVNDMDNYRSAINYELQYVQFPNSPREDYTSSWEKVIQRVYESDNFGGQLKRTRFLRDILEGILTSEMDQGQKAAAIFNHVKQQMTWNGLYGYVSGKGLKKAYEERSGNIGDINLLLVAMLREAGLAANPVLISTRDHGVPLLPTQEGFNYIVAAVMFGDAYALLDATNNYTKPNLLPTRALNWYGKIIDEKGAFKTISVFPTKPSKENHMFSVSLTETGDISGKMRSSYTDYRAFNFRNKHGGTAQEEYLTSYENDHQGFEIEAYERSNLKKVGKPIMEQIEFTLRNQATLAGGKIYFSPLFYFPWKTNPFKQETRNYPIDFAYPWQEKYTFMIKLPEGYTVEALPQDLSLALPDQAGSFSFQVIHKGNQLQVAAEIQMNQAVLPAQYYGPLRELFKNIMQKGSEQVVLTKTSSDGSAQRPKGGR